MAGRRSSADLKWQEVKKKVRARDANSDRLLRVLTVKEVVQLKKCAPNVLLQKLDCAHYFSVGLYPELCYCESNLVLLNRWSHGNMDNCRHPITGEPISYEERQEWWARILGGSQLQKIQNILNNKEGTPCLPDKLSKI